ncbi:conserved exported hypothetical protein [uncultured Alphaproteobacteria bacterium]|uniref:Uncharacterized protein n=1 Tax=uncultured Alphaproteobacteria bacterium TaxID=91750 RepID=A0A212K2A7_9PROT|nr:conserved exported hypothetical protein [uncultured Alphaproteobacteria bacterium]
MRDLKNNISVVASLLPAARTASANGTSADLNGFGSAVAVVEFGTRTDGTHTPALEESDDGTTFTAAAASDLLGSFTACSSASTDEVVQRVGYIGSKRYIRVAMTVASATSGALSSAVIVLGHPDFAPVA